MLFGGNKKVTSEEKIQTNKELSEIHLILSKLESRLTAMENKYASLRGKVYKKVNLDDETEELNTSSGIIGF